MSALLIGGALLIAAAPMVRADAMADAQAVVDRYASKVTAFDGPTSGPKIQADKTVVVLAADMKNGGVLGVVSGIEEAAAAAGWTVRTIDGAGSISGRTAAVGQGIALNPSGIVIAGFDAVEQQAGLQQAMDSKIPIVAWHAAPESGPVAAAGVFANVTTDPMEVAKAAAAWAYLDAKGKPGVVIFTDSTYAVAIAKADAMKVEIERLGGTVVEYVDTPIAETSSRMPQLTTSLLQRHGAAWTHSLAINDLYFDFMGPSLASAGIAGNGAPVSVAAGDGSQSAYQRIRAGEYQAVTVAEPLHLQGWQLVDELNRAFAGAAWSGYVSPLHVVTKANVEFDGGPSDAFDPDNGYRDAYKAIWGIQ
ncbi:sugar ABC transporter substrate-binding protein [Aureimonas sp. Leaf454]|uniref:substrate-binding domain-containing protein n=1 Tax=Aureimonas sp. Leaf454 TaxID=1736381 RepID=UPI0006F4B0B7|nr:substrate-binding domain-containing protein [Aureimonas sp. Leaf454]KQT54978.1 sugar ABC transporter substrate-binding protein [Aureimonas sp. Leaf454]